VAAVGFESIPPKRLTFLSPDLPTPPLFYSNFTWSNHIHTNTDKSIKSIQRNRYDDSLWAEDGAKRWSRNLQKRGRFNRSISFDFNVDFSGFHEQADDEWIVTMGTLRGVPLLIAIRMEQDGSGQIRIDQDGSGWIRMDQDRSG
jgi:hypothetical protein